MPEMPSYLQRESTVFTTDRTKVGLRLSEVRCALPRMRESAPRKQTLHAPCGVGCARCASETGDVTVMVRGNGGGGRWWWQHAGPDSGRRDS